MTWQPSTWRHNKTRPTILASLMCFLFLVSAIDARELNRPFPIQGNVPNMQQTASVSGLSLRVNFQQIQYRGDVKSTSIVSQDGDQAVIEMELENVVLTIGRTSIQGTLRIRAECGPMQIQMGTRRNLKFRFQTRGGVNGLQVVRTDLRLDPSNWSIGSPSSVQVSGFGVTESRVVSGLKSGLQDNLRSVEDILADEAPRILLQRETELVSLLQGETKSKLATSATRGEKIATNRDISTSQRGQEPAAQQHVQTPRKRPEQRATRAPDQALPELLPPTLTVVADAAWTSGDSNPVKPPETEPMWNHSPTSPSPNPPVVAPIEPHTVSHSCTQPTPRSAVSGVNQPIRSILQQTIRLLSFTF